MFTYWRQYIYHIAQNNSMLSVCYIYLRIKLYKVCKVHRLYYAPFLWLCADQRQCCTNTVAFIGGCQVLEITGERNFPSPPIVLLPLFTLCPSFPSPLSFPPTTPFLPLSPSSPDSPVFCCPFHVPLKSSKGVWRAL